MPATKSPPAKKQSAAEVYAEHTADIVGGKATRESWEIAFHKISGICVNIRIQREDPVGAEHRHIASFLAKVFGVAFWRARQAVENAAANGWSSEAIWTFARSAAHWGSFVDSTLDEAPAKEETNGRK